MNDTMRKLNLKKKVAFLLALSMVSGFSNTITAKGALSNVGKTTI